MFSFLALTTICNYWIFVGFVMLTCSTRLYGPWESRGISMKSTIAYLAYSTEPGIYGRCSTDIWMNAWHSRSSLTSEPWAPGQKASLRPAGISSIRYLGKAGQEPNSSSQDSEASPGQRMADCQLNLVRPFGNISLLAVNCSFGRPSGAPSPYWCVSRGGLSEPAEPEGKSSFTAPHIRLTRTKLNPLRPRFNSKSVRRNKPA